MKYLSNGTSIKSIVDRSFVKFFEIRFEVPHAVSNVCSLGDGWVYQPCLVIELL